MDNSSDETPHSWAKKPRERIFPDNMSSSDNINSDSKHDDNQNSSNMNSNDEYTTKRGGRRANARSAGKALTIT